MHISIDSLLYENNCKKKYNYRKIFGVSALASFILALFLGLAITPYHFYHKRSITEYLDFDISEVSQIEIRGGNVKQTLIDERCYEIFFKELDGVKVYPSYKGRIPIYFFCHRY